MPTQDPKYQGIYDDRPLDPGNVAELNQVVRDAPWDADRLAGVYEKLYDGAARKAADYRDVADEIAALEDRPGRRGRDRLRDLRDDLDRLKEWFAAFDRRVYLCHLQMAAGVSREWQADLAARYLFAQAIQSFGQTAGRQAAKATAAARELFDHGGTAGGAEEDDILRRAWKALKGIARDARDLDPDRPDLPAFAAGGTVADVVLGGRLVPEPPFHHVKPGWAEKLIEQLRGVRKRCARLHAEGLADILALQDRIAAAWRQLHAPVEAAVVAEPVEAIPAEVLDADVLDAEVVGGDSVVEAEVIAPPPPPAAPRTADLFALDAIPPPPELIRPAPPRPMPPPPPIAPPAAVGDLFSLDADARPPDDLFSLDADARPPAPPSVTDPLFTPVVGATVTKPAKNGRPAMKITYVRPGEKSPL